MVLYQKTITIDIEAKQYFGIGCMFADPDIHPSDKLDEFLEFERWLLETFPTVKFKYIGSNLVYSQTRMLSTEIEPGDWVIKWANDEYPSVLPDKQYHELMKGFVRVG